MTEVDGVVVKKHSTRNIWLLLLVLVLGSNFALYHSSFGISLLPENPNGVIVGSLIDLTIVAPVLFLTWRRKLSWKKLVVLMAGGLVAGIWRKKPHLHCTKIQA